MVKEMNAVARIGGVRTKRTIVSLALKKKERMDSIHEIEEDQEQKGCERSSSSSSSVATSKQKE